MRRLYLFVMVGNNYKVVIPSEASNLLIAER